VTTGFRELGMSLLSKSVFLFQELSKVLAESVSNFLIVHPLVVPGGRGFSAESLTLVLHLEGRLLLLLDVFRNFE
jgi:hypothetical protein